MKKFWKWIAEKAIKKEYVREYIIELGDFVPRFWFEAEQSKVAELKEELVSLKLEVEKLKEPKPEVEAKPKKRYYKSKKKEDVQGE